jgi:hypothetical protein
MELARLFDGRKFMWDGKEYNGEVESRNKEEHYRSLGFEVRSLVDDGKHYVFTRRVVNNQG